MSVGDGALDTGARLAVFLYRVEDSRGDYLHGAMRTVSSSRDVELLGVATRRSQKPFNVQESRETFRENINEYAEGVRWFDSPIPTDDGLAEFLYRADWGDDAHLYAATKEEVAFTSHEIIGVAVRPPRETVETTRWGRDEFAENVADVATDTVWFDQ